MALSLKHLNPQQKEAVLFGDSTLMVIAGAGCITGDSVINFNRCGKGFKKTIREAYKSFNQKGETKSYNWDLEHPTFVRSFQGHLIKLNQIKGIVKSGRRVVYKLTLENGYKLKATSDHKIMTNEGFVQLGNLNKKNHLVMCDTPNAKAKKEKPKKRRDKMVRGLAFHPYGQKDKNSKLRIEEHRLVYEAEISGYSFEDFKKFLKQELELQDVDIIKFINPKYYNIHHVDGDPTNNEFDNLVKVTKEDHKKLHKKEQYKCFNQGVPEYVKIKSIKEIGDKMTYDIQCEAPFHNFVANGMVIHNSGKTRVLTYRVAHLIRRGYLPSRIWVTTFTTKAAEEMRERLENLIGENKADRLKIGTFHSLCLRLLKDLLESSGKYETPRLMMGGGRWMTMLKIIGFYKCEGYKANRFATKDIKALLNNISYWKNEGKRIKDIEEDVIKEKIKLINGDPKKDKNWCYTLYGTYLQAYKDYEKIMKEQNKIDFDDMLFRTYWELRKKGSKKFLERKRKRIEHILVDEAQDLNRIQFLLVKLIAGDNRRITMVGDDYQVLYGFRGAKVTEIIDFGKFYNATTIKLEQNYRSTKKIVEHGNKLIKHNTVQVWKNLFTTNEEGPETVVMLSEDVEDEAYKILEKIESMIIEGYELNDIAILYRTNAQSRAIVDQFIINHIPHKLYSKEGFYDRKEVKDILAYLKIVSSPHEAEMEDFKRIINRPSRFLGVKFIDALEDLYFERDHNSFWQSFQNYHDVGLGSTQLSRARNFCDMVERINKRINTTEITTKEILQLILEETGYLKWFNKENEKESEDADEDTGMNLESLLTSSERFSDPHDFLMFVESLEFEKNEEEDAIHCLTIHKSKGTEFPVVFIIGMCEPVMPHYRADDLEEERRIAYVGVTRAKEELHISTIHGKFNKMIARPSRFIEEMGAVVPSRFNATDFFTGIDKALGKDETMLTKYDVNGKIISITPIMSGEEIGKVVDATIGAKYKEQIESGGDDPREDV